MIDPVALPGVQDKVLARMISVPVGQASNRYILKINPPEYPHVVENEAYFLGVARAMKMPVADAEVVRDADGRAGLLVRRYDRMPGPSAGSLSLACEDACQLLDRWPSDKYRWRRLPTRVGWRTPADWSWLSAARAAVGVTPYALAAISALRTGCAGKP
jgi:serine/threonine-protein kinase HipA